MSKQIILRQKESPVVVGNGHYKTDISDPITIETGDQILLQHCSIDTVDQSDDRIVLKEDVRLTIQNGFYMLDWDTGAKAGNYTGLTTAPTGKNYVLMRESGNELITTVVFAYNNAIPGGNPIWGGITAYFDYIDTSGDPQEASFYIPKHHVSFTSTETWNANITCREGSFALSPKSTPADLAREPYFAELQTINTTPVVGTDRWDPFLVKSGYIIPKGSYSTTEFAEIITRKLVLNKGNVHVKITDTEIGLNNPFLYLSTELDDIPGGIGPTFWEATNVDNRVHYNINSNKLIGTSQVALEYNQTIGRFQFTATHLPPYDDEGNVSVGYRLDGQATPEFFTYDKNGGIFFTQFDSVYTNGEEIDIFQDILGFSRDTNIVAISPNQTHGGGYDYTFIADPLVVGNNITGEFPGIDTYIDKDSATNYNIVNPATDILATSSGTLPIEAVIPFQDNEIDSAYYQLELYNSFRTDTTLQTSINHNIFALVSKYYSYRSYTLAEGNQGFGYIHNSVNPLILQGVEVFIRDPNTDELALCGDDNTVVLKVIKANNEEKMAIQKYLEENKNKEKK